MHFRPAFLLTALLTAAPATSQQTLIGMPAPFGQSLGSAAGFWFQLPASGTPIQITGLHVPVITSATTAQSVAVRRFSSAPPSGNGTTLFTASNITSGSVIACNVLVMPGDIIAVLGGRQESYFGAPLLMGVTASLTFNYPTSAAGNPITVNGVSALPVTGPIATSYSLGIVDVYAQPAGPLASRTSYGTGCHGLLQSASTNPVLGTTINLNNTLLPAGTTIGATIKGLVRHDPGVDLSAYGMTGCFQYVSTDAVQFWTPLAGVIGVVTWALPNNPALAGLDVFTQGAAFAPGVNPMGVVTSNGLTLHLEMQ